MGYKIKQLATIDGNTYAVLEMDAADISALPEYTDGSVAYIVDDPDKMYLKISGAWALTSKTSPRVAWPLPNKKSASNLIGSSANIGTPKTSSAPVGGKCEIFFSNQAHRGSRASRAKTAAKGAQPHSSQNSSPAIRG